MRGVLNNPGAVSILTPVALAMKYAAAHIGPLARPPALAVTADWILGLLVVAILGMFACFTVTAVALQFWHSIMAQSSRVDKHDERDKPGSEAPAREECPAHAELDAKSSSIPPESLDEDEATSRRG